jgi:hypothetical protein
MQHEQLSEAALSCCLLLLCLCWVNLADLKPGQQYYYKVLGTSDSSSSSSSDEVREMSPKTSKLFNFTVGTVNFTVVRVQYPALASGAACSSHSRCVS